MERWKCYSKVFCYNTGIAYCYSWSICWNFGECELSQEMWGKPQGGICPRCETNKMYSKEVYNALSRRDNKTYICSDCGQEEAFVDTGLGTKNFLIKEESFKFKIFGK